jgi:hypothetical protein
MDKKGDKEVDPLVLVDIQGQLNNFAEQLIEGNDKKVKDMTDKKEEEKEKDTKKMEEEKVKDKKEAVDYYVEEVIYPNRKVKIRPEEKIAPKPIPKEHIKVHQCSICHYEGEIYTTQKLCKCKYLKV